MLLGLIILCGLLSIVYGVYTVSSLMAADAGSQRMQEIGPLQEFASLVVGLPYLEQHLVEMGLFFLIHCAGPRAYLAA